MIPARQILSVFLPNGQCVPLTARSSSIFMSKVIVLKKSSFREFKLEQGAFRFQTVPLKAKKHRPVAFAVTCGPPGSTGPLLTASPAPHQSCPTRAAPANRTELGAQDALGHAQQKAAVQSPSYWTMATQHRHAEFSSLGSTEGSLEASVGQCPALVTSSGAAGHGSCPRRSGNKLLGVPSDVGSGHEEHDTGRFL